MSSPRRLRWHNVAATIVWGLLWRCTEVVGTTTTAPKDPLEEQCPASTAAPVNPYGYRPPSGKSAALVTELLHPFSLQTFVDDFWEKRPLVVRGRSPDYAQRVLSFGLPDVDTVIENGVSLSGTEPYLVSGSDWKIVKRVFNPQDGEFWSAAFTPPSPSQHQLSEKNRATGAPITHDKTRSPSDSGPISLDQVRGAFTRGGFSVVINRLQRRWRGVASVALAMEEVLGHPVNANLYMTPPGRQAFEAHFDWMDGLIVQVAGSKTWIVYDELVSAPRPDLKFKPPAAHLGEPIAVMELHPGDMLYIPRGYPHEAAVNGTERSRGSSGVSLHVTFGIESALSGSYESLLHHALEATAEVHPEAIFDSPIGEQEGGEGGEGQDQIPRLPWLQLLHLCVHDVASRHERLRKSVPLAPVFLPPGTVTTATKPSPCSSDVDSAAQEGGCTPDECRQSADRQEQQEHRPPVAVGLEFQQVLEVFEAGVDALSTLKLLDSLLDAGDLERVTSMFTTATASKNAGKRVHAMSGGSTSSSSSSSTDSERGETRLRGAAVEWNRSVFEGLDRGLIASSLADKVKAFLRAVSLEAALEEMVSAESGRLNSRAISTERDLARCGQA